MEVRSASECWKDFAVKATASGVSSTPLCGGMAFSGLRAAPSVPQVNNKLSRVGCVRRSSTLQSINSVMNPMDDPILKEAMKEPIAFLGGIFAGLLRLDLNEEPLKDWVAKTAEAAGIDLDDSEDFDSDDSIPEDIRID